MEAFASNLSSYSVNKINNTIIYMDETYWFIVGINEHPEKIKGFNITSWRTCGRIVLEPTVWDYLKTHQER